MPLSSVRLSGRTLKFDDVMLTPMFRSNATRRRAGHDLRHMLGVLRHLFLWQIYSICLSVGDRPHRPRMVYHGAFHPPCRPLSLSLILCQARYYHTKDPQFHQDAYAVLTMIVLFSNMWIMERTVRPSLRLRDRKRAPGSSVPPSHVILKEMWLMVAIGK